MLGGLLPRLMTEGLLLMCPAMLHELGVLYEVCCPSSCLQGACLGVLLPDFTAETVPCNSGTPGRHCCHAAWAVVVLALHLAILML